MRTDPTIDLGVIDLGPDRPGPDPTGPIRRLPVPAGAARPRPGGVPLLRWWPLTALALVLVASTAAADPVAPGLVMLYQIPTTLKASATLDGTTVYVATGTPVSGVVEDPEWTIGAYRLADGAPRWAVPHDETARHSSISVQVVGDVPLVTGWRRHAVAFRPPVDYDGRTTAYEPGTGEPLWTRPGFLRAGRPDGRVVLELPEYAGSPPEPIAYTTTTVDLASGSPLWTHQLRFDGAREQRLTSVWTVSDDGRYLATLRRDGRLAVHDLVAGVEAVQQLAPWNEASLVTARGVLRISMLKDRQRTLAAYDLYPPAERWSLTELPPSASLTPCGPVLCLHGPDGLRGLDPATGTPRWYADPTWTGADAIGPPWPDDRLQVTRTPPAGPDFLVVEAATGRKELELAGWQVLGAAGHPYPLVVRREEDAHRPGHPDYDPGRLWLGRVHPEPGEVEVLGALDYVRSCELGERHLVCVSTRQRVEVWRIR